MRLLIGHVQSFYVTVALKKEVTGGYSVRCVELPAAISQGETEEEAVRNVREAIELVLEELEARAQAQKPDKLELVTVSV
jgi:predicted RNase H-like HicB family nuclease